MWRTNNFADIFINTSYFSNFFCFPFVSQGFHIDEVFFTHVIPSVIGFWNLLSSYAVARSGGKNDHLKNLISMDKITKKIKEYQTFVLKDIFFAYA